MYPITRRVPPALIVDVSEVTEAGRRRLRGGSCPVQALTVED
ncbi:hypothetical protein ABGB18_25425 [Nonomuraea sp. B12E4]